MGLHFWWWSSNLGEFNHWTRQSFSWSLWNL